MDGENIEWNGVLMEQSMEAFHCSMEVFECNSMRDICYPVYWTFYGYSRSHLFPVEYSFDS